MPPPPRIRPKRRWRVLAIAMTACAVASAAVGGTSLRWEVGFVVPVAATKRLRVSVSGADAHSFLWTTRSYSKGSWILSGVTRAGMEWRPRLARERGGAWSLVLPLWIPTAACALAATALWRIDATHRHRLRTGLCPACGYPRAGLPAAAACPECGGAPVPAAAVSR